MTLLLLDESLHVKVFYEEPDCDFEDNICISVTEVCPEDEKIFIYGETNIFLTAEQAKILANDLVQAIEASELARKEKCK